MSAPGSAPPPLPTLPRTRPRITSTGVLTGVLLVVLLGRPLLLRLFDRPQLRAWATVFTAVCVQALPFLVLGVVLSAVITAFVPASFFARALPRRPVVAVPVAGVAGVVLPGCECGSIPVAAGLMARRVPAAAALAFLLSSPAINPVVLVATAVAFPGQPVMVVARFAASLAAAVAVGWMWAWRGRPEWISRFPRAEAPAGADRWRVFRHAFRHDAVQAGGFLVVGALTSATLTSILPRGVLDGLTGGVVVPVVAMAVLAVLLAVCSEADAFIAASLAAFPATAKLVFMVVGPMVDVKLVALQAGTFGWRFAARFAPLTFATALGSSLLVGWWLL